MATLEERVAYLEGRGEDHAAGIAEVRLDVRDVRAEIRDFRAEMNYFRSEMNRRFDQTDVKFTWMVGFQFATLLALIGALLNTYLR